MFFFILDVQKKVNLCLSCREQFSPSLNECCTKIVIEHLVSLQIHAIILETPLRDQNFVAKRESGFVR